MASNNDNRSDELSVGLFTVPKITVGAGVAGVVLVGLLTAAFHFSDPQLRPTVVFLAAGIAGIGAVLGAIHTGKIFRFYLEQEKRLLKQAVENEALSQQLRALEYGKRWNAADMFEVRTTCRKIISASGKTQKPLKMRYLSAINSVLTLTI